MGVFTEVEITVEFEEAKYAQTFVEQINNLNDEITKRGMANGVFTTNVDSIDIEDDNVVIINLNSEKTGNAEWQTKMISNIAKEYREKVFSFHAVMTCPEIILYWEGDDEHEII